MSDSSDVAIRVHNVGKTFSLPHERTTSLKSMIVNFYKRGRSYEQHKILDGVSFEIKKGEFFGIVGRNGSGKSTMLKLLAGIYTPTAGDISVYGNLTPFIELGVGFNPELTGRENVFLNGALLGFNRKDMRGMYDEIVEFAELERFMDQKLKNYSSGMQVRLAFSIAIKAQSDILLFDEVLAVGDERFQNKCLRTFQEMKKTDTTIVLVSHDMATIKRFCDRAVVIHDGELIYEGSASEAANQYTQLNFPEAVSDKTSPDGKKQQRLWADLVRVNDKPKHKSNVLFRHGDKLTFNIHWKPNTKAKNVGVALFSESGQYVFGSNTIIDKKQVKGDSVEYDLSLNVGDGDYYIQVGVFGETDADKIYYLERGFDLKVMNDESWQGMTHLQHEWRV
jgi:ABC-2 type transport system ATP-binding protein